MNFEELKKQIQKKIMESMNVPKGRPGGGFATGGVIDAGLGSTTIHIEYPSGFASAAPGEYTEASKEWIRNYEKSRNQNRNACRHRVTLTIPPKEVNHRGIVVEERSKEICQDCGQEKFGVPIIAKLEKKPEAK